MNVKRTRYHWVYLLPLIAVSLDDGDTSTAVAAARRLLRPGQALLPATLTAQLEAACQAWDADQPDKATRLLADVLQLASSAGFC
jgi:hypothetical protein